MLGSSNQSTREGKRSLHSIWQQKSVGTLSAEKRNVSASIPGTLLNGPHTVLILGNSARAQVEGRELWAFKIP